MPTLFDIEMFINCVRHLAKSGAHVVFAVADVDAAREMIAKWEDELTGNMNPLLNCEVWCSFFFLSFFIFPSLHLL